MLADTLTAKKPTVKPTSAAIWATPIKLKQAFSAGLTLQDLSHLLACRWLQWLRRQHETQRAQG